MADDAAGLIFDAVAMVDVAAGGGNKLIYIGHFLKTRLTTRTSKADISTSLVVGLQIHRFLGWDLEAGVPVFQPTPIHESARVLYAQLRPFSELICKLSRQKG